MITKPPSCYSREFPIFGTTERRCCALAADSKGFSYPDGAASAGILAVGDYLRRDDAIEGLPIRPYTPAGSILNRALAAAGMTRQQIGLYNIVACQPALSSFVDSSAEYNVIEHCSHNLKAVYNYYNAPPVILAMGALATRTLTGLAGDRLGLDMLQGFPLAPNGTTVPYMLGKSIVVPTYHPEYIERGNPQLLLVLIRDLRFAFDLAKRLKARFSEVEEVKATFEVLEHKPDYLLHASTQQLRDFYENVKRGYASRLSYDFETTGKADETLLSGEETYQAFTHQKITQVNFSIDRNHALVADYTGANIGIIQDILAMTPNVPKIGHNSFCFDEPVAWYNGFAIRSEHHDTMWKFHHIYPDLPGGNRKKDAEGASLSENDGDEDGALAPLQFCAAFYGFPLPWKHLFKADPHLYGAYDSDGALWVNDGTDISLDSLKLRDSYNMYVVRLRQVLKDMERRGVPCNRVLLKELSNELGSHIEKISAQIQEVVPIEALPLHPPKGYKKPPKDLLTDGLKAMEGLTEEEKATFDVAAFALQKRYVWRLFSLTAECCSCITTYDAEALAGCTKCYGSGLKAGTRTVKCKECTQPSSSCENCQGKGFIVSKYARPKGPGKKQRRSKSRNDAQAIQLSLLDGLKTADGDEQPVKFSLNLDDADEGEMVVETSTAATSECTHDAVEMYEAGRLKPIVICRHCGLKAITKRCKCSERAATCKTCNGLGKRKEIVQRRCACVVRAKADPNCQKCYGKMLWTGTQYRWAKLKKFNPSSPKQMMNYAKLKGYKIPMNSKRKLAMDAETVIKLRKKYDDPVLEYVQQHRIFSKIKSSYADAWLDKSTSLYIDIDAKERDDIEREYLLALRQSNLATVHTSFQFLPATKQLSSRGPNVQVTLSEKHGGYRAKLAQQFRRQVEAPKGYTLIEFDYKSFHALTLGYMAQDAAYIRLARIDAHSYLAANMLRLEGSKTCLALPDDELRIYLNYVKEHYKKERNKKAKPAILGYGFGMGAGKLYNLNEESFVNVEEAKYTIDMLDSCFPEVAKYRRSAPEQAHKQMYQRSPHGCIRWFTAVKSWDSERSRWRHGPDWEKSIAFCPANVAFCIIQERMVRLFQQRLAARYLMINNIHDALLFCVRNDLVEECLHTVGSLLQESDSTVLAPDGSPIWCEVEAKIGPNWADMEERKLVI